MMTLIAFVLFIIGFALFKCLSLPLLLLFCVEVFADCQQLCADNGSLSIKLSAGQGQIASPLEKRDDIEFNFLPSISYYNDRFYIENTKLGLNIINSEKYTLDLVGKHNRDGVFYLGNSTGAGFIAGGLLPDSFIWPNPEAHLSYLAGLEATYYLTNDSISFGAYNDVSNVHYGDELELRWSHIWLNSDWKLASEIGVIYKSKQTLNYYYGSPLSGARNNYFFKLDLAYEISEVLWFVANYHGERVSQAMRSSKAVTQDYLHSGFIGFSLVLDWSGD